MRYFRRLFYKPKHAADTGGDYGIYRSLAPSVAGIALCTACLCGTSWAWFTATATTGVESIQTATYSADAKVTAVTDAVQTASLADEAGAVVCEKDADGITTYKFPADGAYSVTLAPAGTAANGYCVISFGNKTYRTPQLTVGSMTIVVYAAADQTLIVAPQWGTYSGDATIIEDGDVIGELSGSGSSEGADSSSTGDDEPASSEESVPAVSDSASSEEGSSVGDDSSSSESSVSSANADAATGAGTSATVDSSAGAAGRSGEDSVTSAVAGIAVQESDDASRA